MDFIGGIEGMKFTPVSNYNTYLNNVKSFDVNSGMDFENILDKQTAALQNNIAIQGGVTKTDFEDVLAQTSVQSVTNEASTGKFMQSFSNAVNNGLNSVNESITSANKAQEAFAMGEDVSVHDVMIASEKASLNLQMAMQLRNKFIAAYNEINNVRV